MEKLLNDQMLNRMSNNAPDQQSDVLVAYHEQVQEKESEIGNGNLQDYLEIFGDIEDI
ncbi:hypothetical protein [Roseimarinus sediminis]|jgi:hypothetical protein|uniref:hypothetical protein n=1 Tax=Roseimarinus sediminis TaxID=1610899 RepID=UPI003D210054